MILYTALSLYFDKFNLHIEDIANTWKSVICIGSGNEGNSSGHISGRISKEEDLKIELAVQENELGLNVQIWKAYFDEMDIILESPSGIRVGPIQEVLGTQRFTLGGTQILLYYGEPKPYSIDQEIFIDFIPDSINKSNWSNLSLFSQYPCISNLFIVSNGGAKSLCPVSNRI